MGGQESTLSTRLCRAEGDAVDKDAVAALLRSGSKEVQVLNPAEEMRCYSSTRDNHEYSSPGTGPADARSSMLDGPTGWVADNPKFDQAPYVEIDLGEVRLLCGVVVQPRIDGVMPECVTKYSIRVSMDGSDYWQVLDEDGLTAEFEGNQDGSDRDAKVETYFVTALFARYMRIRALAWQNWPSCRAGAIAIPAVTAAKDLPATEQVEAARARER